MSPIRKHRTVVAFALAVGVLGFVAGYASRAADEKPARFFELRTYTTHDGKLEDLHKRFREHTNRLFVKHGMELVGYWTPTDEKKSKNTLVYVLAYKDKESRDAAWKAFLDDEDWKKAYAESHKDGPIVAKVESVFLTPTDYSPIR